MGWVEQREIHHLATGDAMGIAPLNPFYVLIDATGGEAASAMAAHLCGSAALTSLVISSGVYHLMWDLAKDDLPHA